MIEENDLLFEEQLQREMDLRFCGAVSNAADVLGFNMLTVDDDMETSDAD
jgi:hypothetical protein